jgi:DNA-binding PadR family transcriptional regulator
MSQLIQGARTQTQALAVPLPLTHPIYHILLVLATGERHGYGLRRDIAASTEGRLRVGSGSLYRSLDVMLTAGLIDETRGTVDDAPELRRLFRLTDLGERIARVETARLAHLVAVARRVPRLWDDPAPGAVVVSPTNHSPASHTAHSAYGREES